MFECQDIACEILQFLCVHQQVHTCGLVCAHVARMVFQQPNSHVSCSTILAEAIENGHMLCIKHIRDTHGGKSYIWPDLVCADIAGTAGDHVDCLKYVHENGCSWDYCTCADAAAEGNVKCLQYAHKHGSAWNDAVCSFAGRYGHIACVRYARENGCPWSPRFCFVVATEGHLECLQYAHEHGCPWDESTCSGAAFYGQYDCLVYACENGCPCGTNTLDVAIFQQDTKCLAYLVGKVNSVSKTTLFRLEHDITLAERKSCIMPFWNQLLQMKQVE